MPVPDLPSVVMEYTTRPSELSYPLDQVLLAALLVVVATVGVVFVVATPVVVGSLLVGAGIGFYGSQVLGQGRLVNRPSILARNRRKVAKTR